MKPPRDYPVVGVCKWLEWSQEAACWLIDPRRGDQPAQLFGSGYLFALRQVRSRPWRSNPWYRHFSRHAMTPREAFLTIRKGA